MKKFLMAALAVTALTTGLYASTAEAGTGTGGAVIGIPANVVTIGPCKLFDTDGGDVPTTGGYVAGLCDRNQIASYTYYSPIGTQTFTTPAINAYNILYPAYPITIQNHGALTPFPAPYPFFSSGMSADSGFVSFDSLSAELPLLNVTSLVNQKYAFIGAPDTQIFEYNNANSGLAQLEYVVGSRAGFTPVLTIQKIVGGSVVILSGRIRSCSSAAIQHAPQNITSNVFGLNIAGAITDQIYYSGPPSSLVVSELHDLVSCTPIVVQTGTSTK